MASIITGPSDFGEVMAAQISIERSLKTLIRGLTQNDLTDTYQSYKTLYQLGVQVIPYVHDAVMRSQWSKVRYPNEIRYVTGLINLIQDLDEAEAARLTSELQVNGCDRTLLPVFRAVCSFTVKDYTQYNIDGIKIFEHKRLVTKQNVKEKLSRWLKGVPAEDLRELDRVYILRAGDLNALGSYRPILYSINLIWDDPYSSWNPLSWRNSFLGEHTFYHEIGHHLHRHKFGQEPEQEDEADRYATRILFHSSYNPIVRAARVFRLFLRP